MHSDARSHAEAGVAHRVVVRPSTAARRRRHWGYGVWGAFGVIMAVPELWAAVSEKTAPFPTISATVGELEYRWPTLAVAVVAVVVLAAYGASRLPPSQTGVLPSSRDATGEDAGFAGDPALPNRTPSGRLTQSQQAVHQIGAGAYFLASLAVIAAATAAVAVASGGLDEFSVGRTLYGLTALLWVVVPSILAWPARRAVDVPYPTLLETVRGLEGRLHVLAYVVAAGLTILLIHLVFYPWPSIVPDLQRLHKTYLCKPLEPAKHPLTPKQQAQCKTLQEVEVKPQPVSP